MIDEQELKNRMQKMKQRIENMPAISASCREGWINCMEWVYRQISEMQTT